MEQQRILIVSGEAIAATELSASLRALGHEATVVAASGSEAMAMIGAGAADGLIVIPAGSEPRPEVTPAPASCSCGAGPGEIEDRFFDVSIDMLCCLGFDGYARRLNPAWERTLGFTRDELMSRPFLDFVHPDDRQRTLDKNWRVRHGDQSLGFENRYLRKDGSFRWLHWNATPDPARGVIYSAARDVTARKQAEEERERLVSELQGALAEVRALREIIPICSYCRKVRDDEDFWHTVESYVSRHTKTRFSHGICPTCLETEVAPRLRNVSDAE